MNPDQLQLWQRIQAHPLDDPQSTRPFSLRLAKENEWPPGYTRRAIEEYRCFVFLAVAAGHPVSPADAVDQVWHLHLLYTRDYWGDFCGKTLGTPLHHGPARGGAAEADKFADWYARTRESYRRFFGEPPGEFWPERPLHPQAVRVDRARHWIVAKPNWRDWWKSRRGGAQAEGSSADGAPSLQNNVGRKLRAAAVTALYLLAFGPLVDRVGAAPTTPLMWPLDLRGPDFLAVFVPFAVALLAFAYFLRWRLQVPTEGALSEQLDPYEIASLAGGDQRAFVAAVATSVNRGLIALDDRQVRRIDQPLPEDLPLLERAICSAARHQGTALKEVRQAAKEVLDSIESSLKEKNLLTHGADRERARWVPFLCAVPVLLVDMAKLQVGTARDRPVGILIVLTLLVVGFSLGLLLTPRRSRFGGRVLDELKTEHQQLLSLPRPALIGSEADWVLPVAVGLFGVMVLHGTPLEAASRQLMPLDASGGGDGGSGCGGDGGCGGGCGGCGGD